MADVISCEPCELYNLLNQRRSVCRLAEINYLCLIDARESEDYNIGHIVTAKRMKTDPGGTFLLPVGVEIDTMQNLVVYDSNTSSLDEQASRASECAKVLAEVSLCPVRIVRGGFWRFSALYPFLRMEKLMYTIMELEDLKIYPVEIIAGLLYMGDLSQASDSRILTDLKIRAIVTVSEDEPPKPAQQNLSLLNIPETNSVESDLQSSFQKICDFIGSNINAGSRVLVASRQGRSRCSAAVIAFNMSHFKCTLGEAWKHVQKCKPYVRPNTGFLQQLSDWELHTTGARVTNISEIDI